MNDRSCDEVITESLWKVWCVRRIQKFVVELQIVFIQNFHVKETCIRTFIQNCEFSKIFIFEKKYEYFTSIHIHLKYSNKNKLRKEAPINNLCPLIITLMRF